MLKPYRIAVDMDEVIYPMIKALENYGKRTNRIRASVPKPPNKFNYNYAQVFGISPAESKLFVKDFYSSTEAYEMAPIENAQNGISHLTNFGELYLITGRQHYNDAVNHTEYILNMYFPNQFKDYIHTNSFSLYGDEIDKSIVCKNLGIDILIDDSIHNLEKNNGILFGDYQWTPPVDEHNIPWCKNWNEIFVTDFKQ